MKVTANDYVVFGGPRSLFTRKLTAALDFYEAGYSMVDRSPFEKDAYQERANTHQIPLLQTPEDWLIADTTPIIRMLDGRFPNRRLFPPGELGVMAAIVEEVLDEWIARVMVHYRWHYDENALHVLSNVRGRQLKLSELQDFEIYRWGPRACRATGTELRSQQRVAEDEYIGMMGMLENQLASTRYALGDRPSAIDAMLLGGLRAHTLADPIPDLSRFEKILAWEKFCDQGWDGHGDWAPFPESTPFANHMISIAEAEYKPFVLGNARALHSKKKIFDITTYGEKTTYLSRDYPERSRKILKRFSYDVLTNSELASADSWLAKTNLAELFTS